MIRIQIAAAALAAALCLAVPQVVAGPAEEAFLAKLVGVWTGSGAISGGLNGPMACNLTFRAISTGVHYSGKCDVEDVGGRSFAGDLSYNDVAKQYEAKVDGRPVVVGVKHGKSVAFASKLRGFTGTGSTTMTLTVGQITIDTDIVDPETNKPSKSHVVFSK